MFKKFKCHYEIERLTSQAFALIELDSKKVKIFLHMSVRLMLLSTYMLFIAYENKHYEI